jgi:hypothetical protein
LLAPLRVEHVCGKLAVIRQKRQREPRFVSRSIDRGLRLFVIAGVAIVSVNPSAQRPHRRNLFGGVARLMDTVRRREAICSAGVTPDPETVMTTLKSSDSVAASAAISRPD